MIYRYDILWLNSLDTCYCNLRSLNARTVSLFILLPIVSYFWLLFFDYVNSYGGRCMDSRICLKSCRLFEQNSLCSLRDVFSFCLYPRYVFLSIDQIWTLVSYCCLYFPPINRYLFYLLGNDTTEMLSPQF